MTEADFLNKDKRIEEFILAIKNRPSLYNNNLRQFYHRDITENLWEEIAAQFNTNVQYCKNKWGSLRVSFSRQIRNERRNGRSKRGSNNNWYLKSNMSFLRGFMRCRSKESQDAIEYSSKGEPNKPDLEVENDSNLSSSASEIKNEPLLLVDENEETDDNESTASLELLDFEDVLDDIRISPVNSGSASETVVIIEKKTKETTATNPGSSSQKRKSSEQKVFAKKTDRSSLPTEQIYEPPLKKLSTSTPEPSSILKNTKEEKRLSLFTPVNANQNEDRTMTFFKSIFYDFNKLSGRRQRQLKQKLMEDLNELLDQQENES